MKAFIRSGYPRGVGLLNEVSPGSRSLLELAPSPICPKLKAVSKSSNSYLHSFGCKAREDAALEAWKTAPLIHRTHADWKRYNWGSPSLLHIAAGYDFESESLAHFLGLVLEESAAPDKNFVLYESSCLWQVADARRGKAEGSVGQFVPCYDAWSCYFSKVILIDVGFKWIFGLFLGHRGQFFDWLLFLWDGGHTMIFNEAE